jgi:hypothetical protein
LTDCVRNLFLSSAADQERDITFALFDDMRCVARRQYTRREIVRGFVPGVNIPDTHATVIWIGHAATASTTFVEPRSYGGVVLETREL